MRNTCTEAIESASALIKARGSARDRQLRAYYHTHGRFADLVALADRIADVQTSTARHLSIVAA